MGLDVELTDKFNVRVSGLVPIICVLIKPAMWQSPSPEDEVFCFMLMNVLCFIRLSGVN